RTTTAAAKPAAGALARREHQVRHIEGVLEIARAVRILRPQRVLPGLAAVGRAIDPLTGVACVTLRGGDDQIRILRVRHDLVDLRRLLEADVRPRLARVRGLVHAVPRRALDRVAGARIHDVRIGGRDLDRADAVDLRDLVEDRRPRDAAARGFPDAAGRHADV